MGFITDVFEIISKYYYFLLQGVGYTMLIALTGTVAGLAIGLLSGIIRTAPLSRNGFLRALHKIINALISAYIEIFRGTPMMVQAMVIYWGFALFNGGNTLPLIPSGIIIVSINTGAYMAEIVRAGIQSIDKGQMEAARSLGLPYSKAMSKVVLPQAIRTMIPSIINQFIITLKDTSILSVIGFPELVKAGQIVIARNFETFKMWAIIGIMYLIVITTLSKIARALERKISYGK